MSTKNERREWAIQSAEGLIGSADEWGRESMIGARALELAEKFEAAKDTMNEELERELLASLRVLQEDAREMAKHGDD